MPHALPAIPAAKNRFGAALIYHALLRRSVGTSFHGVYLRCEGPVPTPADGPLLIYLNHPAWWDGHMCALIDRIVLRSAFDSYIMMEEPQLERYRFFSWIGAFSVNRHSPREAARSVAYIAGLLGTNPRRLCYIFPQGEITPNDRRPLVVYPGIAHIARRVGALTLWPGALRYELRGEQRPDAFIRLGPAHRVSPPFDTNALSAEVAQRLTQAADALRDDLTSGQIDGYLQMVRGRQGVDRVFDRVMRLLRRDD